MTNTPVVEMPAPTIEDASDNFVSLEMLERGIYVNVPFDPTRAPQVPIDPSQDPGYPGLRVAITGEEGDEASDTTWKPSIPFPVIFFPPEKLKKLYGQVVKVWYMMYPDQIKSSESTYTFERSIYKPQLPDIKDGEMPWPVLDSGFNVVIRPYNNIKVGDQVRVFMAGTNARSSHFIDVVVQNPEENLVVPFPPEKTRLTADGKTYIFYEIKRSGESGRSDISYSVSFNSIPPTPELRPVLVSFDTGTRVVYMTDKQADGSYPFTLEFSSPATKGEKLTIVTLDTSEACKVYERTIEKSGNRVSVLLPGDMFDTSTSQDVIVFRDVEGNQTSSTRVTIGLRGDDETLGANDTP